MLPLPTELPCWYHVDSNKNRGWTPETKDIVDTRTNTEVVNAWNGTYAPKPATQYTVKLDRLQILSPIQVGGGSFPEGGVLPAQVGGVPCIPGSSIRGSLLNWLKRQWNEIPNEEQVFWQSLLLDDRSGWRPRKVRFEQVLLKNLKPFPLHAQQTWQLFDKKSRHLGIQWQVSPKPPSPNSDRFCLQILLKDKPTDTQVTWLKQRTIEMLREQGIGRGTASGFGRLAETMPSGQWQICLQGMKPCVQQQISQSGSITQNGNYRWSPQVLRANLRGYFHRIALSLLAPNDAQSLTENIFGGLSHPAQLVLTSYLTQIPRSFSKAASSTNYTNISNEIVHQDWLINVDCNTPFQPLIGTLLNLASQLGGLGPGWRRPPHVLTRFNGFRGSQFTVTPASTNDITQLITELKKLIQNLAKTNGFNISAPNRPHHGSLVSIWQGNPNQWEDIVHGVCSTRNTSRPEWCGNSESRPSGYAVRQHNDRCLITVFDAAVEETLQEQEFQKIWAES